MAIGAVSVTGTFVAQASHNCGTPAEHVVNGTDGADCHYATIQDAVDAAEPGDTVRIAGTFDENVVIDTSELTLTAGDDTTIVAATDSDPVIRIRAQGVVIDGQDRLTVRGGRTGVRVDDIGGVTVRGIDARSNFRGALFVDSRDNRVKSSTFAENEKDGLIFQRSRDNEVQDVLTTGNNGSGIFLRESAANEFVDIATIDNGNDGIVLANSDANRFANVTTTGNGASGIIWSVATGNDFVDSHVAENGGTGIAVWVSTENNFTRNTVTGNGGNGILSRESERSTFTDHNVSANGANGIYLTDSEGEVVDSTTVTDHRQDGISVRSSELVLVESVVADNTNGVRVLGESSVEAPRNVIRDNELGVLVAAVASSEVTVTANEITGNTEYGLVVRHERWGVAGESIEIENVNATRNWWGHSSGPAHPDKNSNGEGDRVSSNADFTPWLNEEGGEVAPRLPNLMPFFVALVMALVLAALWYRRGSGGDL